MMAPQIPKSRRKSLLTGFERPRSRFKGPTIKDSPTEVVAT
jgi:hypothetical protein